MLRKRQQLLDSSYVNKPQRLSDKGLTKSIMEYFKVDENQLKMRMASIVALVNKEFVYAQLSKKKGALFTIYKKEDFQNEDHWNGWIKGVNQLNNQLMTRMTTVADFKPGPGFKYIPKDMESIVKFFVNIILNGKITAPFFKSIVNCFKLWQVDPCLIYMTFLQTSKLDKIQSNDESEKVFTLAKSAMTFILHFDEWPTQQYKKLANFHADLFQKGKSQFQLCILNVFTNTPEFTSCLEFLKFLEFPEKHNFVSENFQQAVNLRIDSYSEGDNGSDGLKEVFHILDMANYDLTNLQDWRLNHKELNSGFNFEKVFTIELQKRVVPVVNKFLANHEPIKDNLLLLITALSNFSTLAKTPLDYQNSLFNDVNALVDSWSDDASKQVESIVKDDEKLEKLEEISTGKIKTNWLCYT
ncbi:unnamed protein product [Ambrosiozyma monospora]|uniref:Unnamed protein product n=1 Tax=Ambrosiozyma monospora TaxID=43982 RepID=A0ACB5TJX0_AMBMO|nr:unnamed protein product [Ambrosiozyma monospora]